jgi:hypothetical protein
LPGWRITRSVYSGDEDLVDNEMAAKGPPVKTAPWLRSWPMMATAFGVVPLRRHHLCWPFRLLSPSWAFAAAGENRASIGGRWRR